jgi:Sulfotransferase domain
LPRSGTSMMMKMLDAGGLLPLTDGERKSDLDNPKGYYEFERVKKLKEGDVAWLPQAHGKVVKIISALLPHLPDDYDYKIIFMRRKISQILASQRKMLINRGEDPDLVDEAELKELFKEHLLKIERWLETQPNVTHIDVDYNRLLPDPDSYVDQINRFLNGRLNPQTMSAVVDPQLYRQRD